MKLGVIFSIVTVLAVATGMIWTLSSIIWTVMQYVKGLP